MDKLSLTRAQRVMLRVLGQHDRFRDPLNPYVDDPLYYTCDDRRTLRTLRVLDRMGVIELWPDMYEDQNHRWWAALKTGPEADEALREAHRPRPQAWRKR